MKVIDYFLRILGAATIIAALGAPSKYSELLAGSTCLAMGVWGILYPPGVLGWAAAGHKEIDPMDESTWWVSRAIGTIFVVMGVVFLVVHFRS